MGADKRTYAEAIEAVLLNNGYVASLQTIYREIAKYRELTGQTPFATIQERVQRDKRFVRVDKGVYALAAFLGKLPPSLLTPKSKKEKSERLHYRIQGMLLEIGNAMRFRTHCANKNGEFAGKRLVQYASLTNLPSFTYDHIVRRARNVDVLWFNNEGFPHHLYEVDTSTSFQRSLLKFIDLRHFYVEFRIVSAAPNLHSFRNEVDRNVYSDIRTRTKFLSYGQVESMYDASLKHLTASQDFL